MFGKTGVWRGVFMAVSIALLIILFPQATAQADSLWSDNALTSVLFNDQRARRVGDLLTIVVNESSSAIRVGSSTNNKTATVAVDKATGLLGVIPDIGGVGSKDTFVTAGTLNNTNTVTARITVTVTEVKPNGNMVIAGTQNIRQNGEEQRIVISGQVRPSDIQVDNSVLSSNIANAKILVTGSGPLVSKQRQGILTQALNWLF